MVELKVGDKAPDFSLLDEHGLPASLKDYLGKKVVVLYFYPKDFTSGCTAEACSFRDNYKPYQDKGAVVIGVSLDSVESHLKFSEKYNLPFTAIIKRKLLKPIMCLELEGFSQKDLPSSSTKMGR
jgi:peroxiredoxin Q/BCP